MVEISKFRPSRCFENEDNQIQCDVVEIIKTQANRISLKLKESVFVKTAGHDQHKPVSIAVHCINDDNYSWLTPLVL